MRKLFGYFANSTFASNLLGTEPPRLGHVLACTLLASVSVPTRFIAKANFRSSLLSVAALLSLTACGGSSVKETLGIDRRAPDEFRVVSRPPLSVPPQFDLRPPGIEGVDTQSATRDKAQAVVLGNDSGAVKADTKVLPVVAKPVGKAASSSAAESVFLQKAGAAQADPNVKKELAEKKIDEQVKHEDDGWWDRVTTIPDNKEPVVKAEDESERLKKNKEDGKPVTEGETPETGGGPMSTLRHWMGD